MALCTLCSSWGGKKAKKRGREVYYIKHAWGEIKEKWDGNHATTSLKIKKIEYHKKVIFILKLNRDQYCRGYAIHAKM